MGEELLFLARPDCIPSILLCERMAMNEVVIISGAIQFNEVKKESTNKWSFEHVGKSTRRLPPVVDQMHQTCIIAMDAIKGGCQGKWDRAKREMVKAFVAFASTHAETGVDTETISTGNWGCGAFRGDLSVKYILQWISASLANRTLHYYPYGDPRADKLERFVTACRQKKITVAQIWTFLTNLTA